MEARRTFLARGVGLLACLAPDGGHPREGTGARPCRARLALRHEIPRLHYELHVFRGSYLPVVLAPRHLIFPGGVPVAVERIDGNAAGRLQEWQAATMLLTRALPRLGNLSIPADDNLEAFRTFFARRSGLYDTDAVLRPALEPCFTIGDWPPIHWEIDVGGFAPRRQKVVGEILDWFSGRARDPRRDGDELHRHLSSIQARYLAAPADFNWLTRTYTMWLPILAADDLTFALAALDFRRLAEETEERTIAPGLGLLLASVCSCAITFTAATLANNHFLSIRRLLRKPELYGNWFGFVPGIILTVLYRKVVALRELARDTA